MSSSKKQIQLDKETGEVLLHGQRVEDLVGHDGWKTAKKMLFEKLVSLDSIDAISLEDLSKDPQQVVVDLKVRKQVISMLISWIRDVEGVAAQHKAHKTDLHEERREQIIQSFE